jgi:hypothetical protein
MTIQRFNIASITYASDDQTADAPCIFVWDDGRTEVHPKSWVGFFRGAIGGRNETGECEWYDGTGMSALESAAAAFVNAGGAIGAYVAPPPEEPAP